MGAGMGSLLVDTTLNMRVLAVAGAGANDDRVAGGCTALGVGG